MSKPRPKRKRPALVDQLFNGTVARLMVAELGQHLSWWARVDNAAVEPPKTPRRPRRRRLTAPVPIGGNRHDA
jgi:hypothetical protein